MIMSHNDEIKIYQSDDGTISVDVVVQDETVWLTQSQIAKLFGKDRSVIAKHIKNILTQEELEFSVCANFAHTAPDGKVYDTQYYNLDMIISIGYRVNSKQGIQFRRWASKVLTEYLVAGYNINQKKIIASKLDELKKTIDLLSNTLVKNTLINSLGQDILSIISSYAKTWNLLVKYDEERLFVPTGVHLLSTTSINYEDALLAIQYLKNNLAECNEASELFGIESILGNLEQVFSEKQLYPSVEEKAAHLLYFIIKNHPFIDGNKRIACLLFLLFLQRSIIRLAVIENNTLTALALLIAESDPAQKELMIQLIINLLVHTD